jgi:hypothetical protein
MRNVIRIQLRRPASKQSDVRKKKHQAGPHQLLI